MSIAKKFLNEIKIIVKMCNNVLIKIALRMTFNWDRNRNQNAQFQELCAIDEWFSNEIENFSQNVCECSNWDKNYSQMRASVLIEI